MVCSRPSPPLNNLRRSPRARPPRDLRATGRKFRGAPAGSPFDDGERQLVEPVARLVPVAVDLN
eukprot:4983678-Pyramimonas_sp.AAC.1